LFFNQVQWNNHNTDQTNRELEASLRTWIVIWSGMFFPACLKILNCCARFLPVPNKLTRMSGTAYGRKGNFTCFLCNDIDPAYLESMTAIALGLILSNGCTFPNTLSMPVLNVLSRQFALLPLRCIFSAGWVSNQRTPESRLMAMECSIEQQWNVPPTNHQTHCHRGNNSFPVHNF